MSAALAVTTGSLQGAQAPRAPPAARHLPGGCSHVRLTSCKRLRPCAAAATEAATAAAPAAVAPGLLAGSPAPGEDFPFSPEQLVEMAKMVFYETEGGITDDSVLAPDFRFEFPIVKLSREDYLKQVRGFTFKQGIPNLSPNAYHFRSDPYEKNRVWFTIRTSGTHTGPFKFGSATYNATGATIQGPPECCSYTFNKEGKVTSFTGGYVMDNRVGNTDGYGAAFGILAACGVKIPKPNSLQWELAVAANNALQALSKAFGKE